MRKILKTQTVVVCVNDFFVFLLIGIIFFIMVKTTKQNKVENFPHCLRINKVRDHCQITGKQRGVAHLLCNLNTKQTSPNY